MSYISTKLIQPGLVVENTFLHVFNWPNEPKGSRNVECVTLEFSDGSNVTYSTGLHLDLPNGDYCIKDGKYIKVTT